MLLPVCGTEIGCAASSPRGGVRYTDDGDRTAADPRGARRYTMCGTDLAYDAISLRALPVLRCVWRYFPTRAPGTEIAYGAISLYAPGTEIAYGAISLRTW
eukprot:3278427-Rhodomonas_salina.1